MTKHSIRDSLTTNFMNLQNVAGALNLGFRGKNKVTMLISAPQVK